MQLAAIRTFLTVIRTGNLNKAAEELHITQSTVTARLDALEASLGQILLHRSRRGAQLTKAGFAFQPHAEVMLQAWDQARKRIGLPKGFSGLFSFACTVELWEGAAERWLRRTAKAYPELALEAWPGTTNEITAWLQSGLVDAALLPDPISAPGIQSQEVCKELLIQVATTPRAAVRWDPAYIYVDLGAEVRRQHARAWPGEETAYITFGSSIWALNHLLSKGGSAYLPIRLVESFISDRRLYAVEGAPAFERPIYFAWREASLQVYPWIADRKTWAFLQS